MKNTTWALVLAVGKAEQLTSDVDTPFLFLRDRPVLAYSLAALMQTPEIDGIVVSAPREHVDAILSMTKLFGFSKMRKIVAVPRRRDQAVRATLPHLDPAVTCLCLPDPSRPFVPPAYFSQVVRAAQTKRAPAIAATETLDPVVRVKKATAPEVLPSSPSAGRLWTLLSPRAIPFALFQNLYDSSPKKKALADDEFSLLAAAGHPLRLVPVPADPAPVFRLRTKDDLVPALQILKTLDKG